MTGNNKFSTGLLTGTIGLTIASPFLVVGITAGSLIGKYGEDKLSQRSIYIGRAYKKNK